MHCSYMNLHTRLEDQRNMCLFQFSKKNSCKQKGEALQSACAR